MRLKGFLKFGVFFLLLGPIMAQKGELDSKEIVIEKDRKIELPETDRIFEKINFDVPREQYPEQEYDYNVESKLVLNDLNPRMRLQSLKEEKEEALNSGRFKVGLGNYLTSLVKLDWSSKQSSKYAYQIHFDHLSSQKGAVESEKSASSFNNLDINGVYFLKNGSVSAALGLDRQVSRYFGYDKEKTIPTNEQLKIVRPLLYTKLMNDLFFESSQLSLNSNLSFYHLNMERIQNSESEVVASQTGSVPIKDIVKLLWKIEGSFISRKVKDKNLNRHFAVAHLLAQKKIADFELNAGFRLASSADTISTAKSFYFYPLVHVKYDVIPKALLLEIAYGGELENVSVRSISNEVMWLDTGFVAQHNNKKHVFKGFATANLSNALYAKTGFQLSIYDNYYFYMNDFSKREIISPVYDKGRIQINQIIAELGMSKNRFRSSLTGRYSIVENERLKAAYHFPTYQANWNSKIGFAKKLYLSLDAFVIGGLKAYDAVNDRTVPLTDIVDVNIKVDYNFSSKFGVFFMLNNIFGQNYQRYQYYSVRGFQVLAGLQSVF